MYHHRAITKIVAFRRSRFNLHAADSLRTAASYSRNVDVTRKMQRTRARKQFLGIKIIKMSDHGEYEICGYHLFPRRRRTRRR